MNNIIMQASGRPETPSTELATADANLHYEIKFDFNAHSFRI